MKIKLTWENKNYLSLVLHFFLTWTKVEAGNLSEPNLAFGLGEKWLLVVEQWEWLEFCHTFEQNFLDYFVGQVETSCFRENTAIFLFHHKMGWGIALLVLAIVLLKIGDATGKIPRVAENIFGSPGWQALDYNCYIPKWNN